MDGAGETTEETTVVPLSPPPRDETTEVTGATGAAVQVTGATGTGAAVKGGGTIQLTWVVMVSGNVVTGGDTVEGTLAAAVIPAPNPGGTPTCPTPLVTVGTVTAGNGKEGIPEAQELATAGGIDPKGPQGNPPTLRNGQD